MTTMTQHWREEGRQEMQQQMQQQMQQVQRNFVKGLLAEGESVERIARLTRLTVAEIKALAKDD